MSTSRVIQINEAATKTEFGRGAWAIAEAMLQDQPELQKRKLTANTKHPDRRTYLGGNDIATVVGVNPYQTLSQLVLEKRGELPQTSANEAMKMGLLFESSILSRAEEDLGSITQRNTFVAHPTTSYLGGTIDGLAGTVLVDAKNLGHFRRQQWLHGGVPEHYVTQLNYYAALLKLNGQEVTTAQLAVVFGGQTFELVPVQIDDELGAMLLGAGHQFWEKYILDNAEVDLTMLPSVTLSHLFPAKEGEVEIPLEDADRFYQLTQEIAKLEAERDAAKSAIMVAMQSATKGRAGDYTVSWAESKGRTTVDAGRLKKEYPDIYTTCSKIGANYRTFKLAKKGV